MAFRNEAGVSLLGAKIPLVRALVRSAIMRSTSGSSLLDLGLCTVIGLVVFYGKIGLGNPEDTFRIGFSPGTINEPK